MADPKVTQALLTDKRRWPDLAADMIGRSVFPAYDALRSAWGMSHASELAKTLAQPYSPVRETPDGYEAAVPQALSDTGRAASKMGHALNSAFGASYAPQDVMPTNQDAALIAGLAMTGGGFGSLGAGLAERGLTPLDVGQAAYRTLRYPLADGALKPEVAAQFKDVLGQLQRGKSELQTSRAEYHTMQNIEKHGDDLVGINDTDAFTPDERGYLNALSDQQRRGAIRPADDTLYANPKEAAPVGMVAADSQAQRLERAREQGFNTDKVWYHGTNADITAFDPARSGETFKSSGKDKTYFTDYPGYASDVAAFKAGTSAHQTPAVYPVFLKDAVETLINEVPKMREATVGDPRNIRSVNANFDPAQANSANLLAANPPQAAAAGLVPGAGDEGSARDRLIAKLTGRAVPRHF